MAHKLTYKLLGVKAIIIEWPSKIANEILEDILSFKEKLELVEHSNYVDLIIAYNSLTIIYKKEILPFENEIQRLQSIYNLEVKFEKKQQLTWQIPVCYDKEFGIDLEGISKKLNIDIDEIISLHSSTIYTVYFIGFLPGFLYLGGLNQKLYIDRRSNPRLKVPKGAVAIGGQQTGIYPSETSGGWHLIGKTPIHFFDANSKQPCFAKAGDCLQFTAVSKTEFYKIEQRVVNKSYQIFKSVKDD